MERTPSGSVEGDLMTEFPEKLLQKWCHKGVTA
jgi:hypothetical protein